MAAERGEDEPQARRRPDQRSGLQMEATGGDGGCRPGSRASADAAAPCHRGNDAELRRRTSPTAIRRRVTAGVRTGGDRRAARQRRRGGGRNERVGERGDDSDNAQDPAHRVLSRVEGEQQASGEGDHHEGPRGAKRRLKAWDEPVDPGVDVQNVVRHRMRRPRVQRNLVGDGEEAEVDPG